MQTFLFTQSSLCEKSRYLDSRIEIIKGIHPGKFIDGELKKKTFTQCPLTEETGIPCRTINAIIADR